MVIAVLIVLGLAFGSFVNALVWRLHEQAKKTRHSERSEESVRHKILHFIQDDNTDELSIMKGRSMCPHCHHELSAKDLIPVLSWLALKGRCRYCHKPISPQYPIVEAATALLFVMSYLAWPQALKGAEVSVFGLWLVLLVGFMALLVYDLRWMLLPNRLVFPLTGVAIVQALVRVFSSTDVPKIFLWELLAAAIGGGIFYILFQVSDGKWIGGGDVKLGFMLGIVVASPARSILVIFLASVLGTLASLPHLASGKLRGRSQIPFGPFLIVAAMVVVLFGGHILHWYTHDILLLG